MQSISRRRFVAASSVSLAVAGGLNRQRVLAREPIARFGDARFKLGLAAYSLRKYFRFSKGKTQTPATDGEPLDMEGFLVYCRRHECDAAELTSYFFRPDADEAYLLGLKRSAFLQGLAISGTAIGNNFTVGQGERLEREIAAAKDWIDKAAILGAPHIRVFAGTGRELRESPERIDEAIEALQTCANHAAKRGVMLGVENHGNLTADEMLEIMSRIDSPWVGMNLDTGNFFSDDPYRDLQRCVGYAVNVQVKTTMRDANRKESSADLERVASILRDGGYQGFVNLEYEGERPYQVIPAKLDELRKALA